MSFLNTLIPGLNGSSSAPTTAAARRPRHEIRETDGAYALTVFLPGVTKEGLEITDENGELTIVGKVSTALPEGAVSLHRETSEASFRLEVTHDGTVDAEKIVAELRDGVLNLTLQKAESAKPRKVTVS